MQPRTSPRVLRSLAIVGLALSLHAQVNPEGRQPIARLGKEAIYEEDLLPLIGGQLLQLKNQEYELRMKALTDLVNRRLLDAEATDKGVSVEDLLERSVRNGLQWNVSELEGFYLARKDSFKKPLDEIRPQVERAFLQAKREQAREDYIDQLRQKADLTILLSRPKPEITADPSRLRGDPNAPVTIVEFADFQCPYSQSMQSVLKEILTRYRGKVRLGFRDFPVREIHPQAQRAAEAARCAGEQGKFWDYHDLLFAGHARLDSDALQEHARAVGLDMKEFSECLTNGRFKEQIDNDVNLGKAFGVTGTPTIYISGSVTTGLQPAEALEKIIDSELAEAKGKKPAP